MTPRIWLSSFALMTLLMAAAPAGATGKGAPNPSPSAAATATAESGDARTTFLALPISARPVDLETAQRICAAEPESTWCDDAQHYVRPPLLCRRIGGVFGLVDVLGIVGLCR